MGDLMETSLDGFVMIYDVRRFDAPSFLSLTSRVATWSSHPTRIEKWSELNLVCNDHASSANCCLSSFLDIHHSAYGTVLLTQPTSSGQVFQPYQQASNLEFQAGTSTEDETDSSTFDTSTENETDLPTFELDLVPELDIGFVHVKLNWLSCWPVLEVCIELQREDATNESLDALFDFMEYVLSLSLSSSGFMLTFDMRKVYTPQLDILNTLQSWFLEQGHGEIWLQRCLVIRIVVGSGPYLRLWRCAVSAHYSFRGPPICTYLVENLSMPIPADSICYGPDTRKVDPSVIVDSPAMGVEGSRTIEPTEENVEPHANMLPGARRWAGQRLPASMDFNMAKVQQGLDPTCKPPGYLCIRVQDKPLNLADLHNLMDFMDAFVDSEIGGQTFSVMYDLREIGWPSKTMISHVVDWGRHPDRQEKWNRLNTQCKVVIHAGMRFQICTGILSAFFSVCPPVCRTSLQVSPDTEEGGAIFEPPKRPKLE